ncbi:MAG TPA: sulfotransferase family 2 domain-containing protein [Acidimicrobiia bacterium]
MSTQSLGARLHGLRTARFLHIGKTAGTALKQALRDAPESSDYHVVVHTHGVRMIDVPRGDKFFFVVRDPVDRFVSAFQARQRQDAPRYRNPWTAAEARAFADFSSPGELGLALAGSGAERTAAEFAMHSIEHVRSSYWDWFSSPAAVRRREHDILWIGFVERLDEQIPDLAQRLGLPKLELPTDDVTAHRSPRESRPDLPPEARDALVTWYRRDYEFLDVCRDATERIGL